MRSHTRISIVQLLVSAIVVTAAPAAQATDRKVCAQFAKPMMITARHGAHIKHDTPTSTAGCGVTILRGRIVRRTLILTVQIYVPGRISVGGQDLRMVSRRLSMASATRLKVRLSRSGLRALRHHRGPKILVRVDFVPNLRGKPQPAIGP